MKKSGTCGAERGARTEKRDWTDTELLMLAAQHLEFGFYFEGAARLRALALAPLFCDEDALELIGKFSRLLEEAWDCDETDLERVRDLQRTALRVLRGENGSQSTAQESEEGTS